MSEDVIVLTFIVCFSVLFRKHLNIYNFDPAVEGGSSRRVRHEPSVTPSLPAAGQPAETQEITLSVVLVNSHYVEKPDNNVLC